MATTLGAAARSFRRLPGLSDESAGNNGKESDAATPRGRRRLPLVTRRLLSVRPLQYVERPHLYRSPGERVRSDTGPRRARVLHGLAVELGAPAEHRLPEPHVM